MLKLAIAQLDPVVGAFEANVRKIRDAYTRACSKGARLLLTPELALCGYPPHDLIDRPEMFERNERALEDLLAATRGQKTALLVGHVAKNPGETGRTAQNVITILQDGGRVFRQAKRLLPTYDVFDEARYFEPGGEARPWNCDGELLGFGICEDFWQQTKLGRHRIYATGPVDDLQAHRLALAISISASPFEWAKRQRREAVHADVARALKAPLLYVNQVGANDEILFDGGSFGLSERGELLGRLPLFKTSFGVASLQDGGLSFDSPGTEGREDEAPPEIEELCRGLIMGIRDYFARTGFKKAVLGLSGGIDSAVVATLACRALGPENVLGVAMPSQFSSAHSLEDAEILARNLGMRLEVRPIKFSYSTLSRELADSRGPLAPLALENLQSRLRGLLLMTLSNHDGSLVLTTGNKSELAMGYCTLYGDMAGALAPLGDVLKTRVYTLARHLNVPGPGPIPERSITKAPSAELRPNQTDQDSLPPYEDLDALLALYVEQGAALEELEVQLGAKLGKSRITEVLQLLARTEHKRRQAAPVLKVSPCAFGIGRRIPVAKSWT